jgi:hypothetical protein
MNQDQLSALLATLTGHLHVSNENDEQQLNELQQAAANALLQQPPESLTNQSFSFSTTDLFSKEKIESARLINIEDVSKALVEKEDQEDNFRLFVRDVPVRTTQIPGSVPSWAAGALLDRSYGPFLTADGRLRWFDFYRIERLIEIYTEGQTLPSILFRASLRRRFIDIINPEPVEVQRHYNVIEGSVWIRASLLSPSAPPDRYCGLKVSGGNVTLDTAPELIDNKLVIKNDNNVHVSINLVQQDAPAATATGDQGIDARNASYTLPSSLSFSFVGLNKTINQISDASWTVYSNELSFSYQGDQNILYNPFISRIAIPFTCNQGQFDVTNCQSPFLSLSGRADIQQSYWALSAATLDINNPLAADGSGAMLIVLNKGLTASWKTLNGSDASLVSPVIFGEPGRIAITDLASNAIGATSHIDLWKDDQNIHGTSVDLTFISPAIFMYNTLSQGDEILVTSCNADVNTDRPVKVNGEAVAVHSKESLVVFAVSAARNILYLLDDNLIWDSKTPFEKVPTIKPISLALENALFTTSPPNGLLLFGFCNDAFTKMNRGSLLLSFGVFSYLPTLPDPYLANLGILRRQFFRNRYDRSVGGAGSMWLWLTCLIAFKPLTEEKDDVAVSFHLGLPPTQQANVYLSNNTANEASPKAVALDFFDTGIEKQAKSENRAAMAGPNIGDFTMMAAIRIPDYQSEWDDRFGQYGTDSFALLDVSSNANQLGVSFGTFGRSRLAMVQTATAVDAAASSEFPIQVQKMQVVSRGVNVRAFLLPLVAWEPVFNLSEKIKFLDPPLLWNYYPDDGGPTRIFNNNPDYVPLAPIPIVHFIINQYKNNPNNKTAALFTLPFGLRAIAALSGNGTETTKPIIDNIQPEFKNELIGGIQIKAWAGNYDVKPAEGPATKDSRMFPGYVIQLNNVLGLDGSKTYASTLGDSVTSIFNGEFFETPLTYGSPKDGRGVPVNRIDFSGYGANMFSNWLSPSAQFAATSQARFDVMLGRTAHEVIQVKSILYPWGIRVVRTITLFRASSGYVYRIDSGWKAESDGKFDFRYKYIKYGTPKPPDPEPYPTEEVTPYQIHPGVISGLYNVQNIKETNEVADYRTTVTVHKGDYYINGITGQQEIASSDFTEQVLCRPVWFDCDVAIENLVMGQTNGRTPAKKVLGYVQLAPTGKPLTETQFRDLLNTQFGIIGGPISCTVDINKSNQQMRVNRFDVNTSVDATNNIAFVAAIRGNVFLPKDGSWSMVQHNVGTGEVTPLAESVTVPLIRKGQWIPDQVIDPNAVTNSLVQVNNPIDLLRDVNPQTINFGFLQSTATQKALFLTPSYKLSTQTLLSKAPPIFADAYRLMSGNGIFPNIGNAVNNFGKAMPLLNSGGVAAFTETVMGDGTKVLELLKIEAEKKEAEVIKQGMSLLQKGIGGVVDKALQFDVPDFQVPLVQMDGLKIYIDYKTKKEKSGANLENSKLNFDVDSFANKMEEQWKSRLNYLSMVVDLGSIQRLMIIKGNFEARKGKESGYEGDTGGFGGLPIPEIEFNEKLQPVIDLLEMLADLSTGNYADALKRGMKVAMSNSGEIWQYKFEASKTIPVLRFPPTDILYNDPNCPLKLEASLDVGVYFNAALKVTTDPKQLLPTAGAYLSFYGSLSVMCVSLSVATIYAVGTVNVTIACDTQKGPSLLLKFGFGAQIVVGLPVVGNVSVLYMIGVEIYAGTDKITLAGFMLFRGQADLLGGLVCVTITIEAKGAIDRETNGPCNCIASVTFALDISIFLVIDISFSKTWSESRQIA